MEQKHFMDISRIKEDTELTESNVKGFEKGDIIQITEKVDGSNASFTYDKETDTLLAFSRRKKLSYQETLNGFWNWVQGLDKNLIISHEYEDYLFFGEWLVSHSIKYKPEAYKNFYLFDVWDKGKERYLSQTMVKQLAKDLNLLYVKEYYYGPFISWEHTRSFAERESDISCGIQEGIVVKNQTKLNDPNSRTPFVLKIVNDAFSEIKKSNHIKKVEDPQKLKEKAHATEIVDMIVTKNRVQKQIFKLIEDGILPEKISSQDMKNVAMNLPSRVYEDCMKEESAYVIEAGEYFGKICSSKTMNLAKEIIFG